jgi:hypothetical protein
MAKLFYQGNGLSKEVWVRWEWKPKLWSRGRQSFFIKRIKKTDKILGVGLERLFWVGNKLGCFFFLWTLGLAFGDFTLCPAEDPKS